MKLFDHKFKENEATPQNTTGVASFSLGNNPSDKSDITKGSGEKFSAGINPKKKNFKLNRK